MRIGKVVWRLGAFTSDDLFYASSRQVVPAALEVPGFVSEFDVRASTYAQAVVDAECLCDAGDADAERHEFFEYGLGLVSLPLMVSSHVSPVAGGWASMSASTWASVSLLTLIESSNLWMGPRFMSAVLRFDCAPATVSDQVGVHYLEAVDFGRWVRRFDAVVPRNY